MSVPGPTLGPCEAWIDGNDVLACCSADPGSEGAGAFDDVAISASMLAFELSGRQFTGLCDRTVRPCRSGCSCFGQSSLGLGPWYWNSASAGLAAGYRNECGDRCGCGSASYVRLAGYPVREITAVKIDGVVLDPSEYRLDGWRKLIRRADPGPPVVNRTWPACQNLALEDTEAGTFSIEYRHGVDPPQLGRDAAAALACQLFSACNGGECKLPSKVTKIVRQGVTIERVSSIAQMLREGSSGIPLLDSFIAGYNPTKMRRRPAVFSPDLQPFARRVGT